MTDSRQRLEVPITEHLEGLVQKSVPPATRTGLFSTPKFSFCDGQPVYLLTAPSEIPSLWRSGRCEQSPRCGSPTFRPTRQTVGRSLTLPISCTSVGASGQKAARVLNGRLTELDSSSSHHDCGAIDDPSDGSMLMPRISF
jgi:hypothetical protein